jgi:hypothetical protein
MICSVQLFMSEWTGGPGNDLYTSFDVCSLVTMHIWSVSHVFTERPFFEMKSLYADTDVFALSFMFQDMVKYLHLTHF